MLVIFVFWLLGIEFFFVFVWLLGILVVLVVVVFQRRLASPLFVLGLL
jgi:hypothetical protein